MTAPLPYSPSGIPQGYQTVVTNTQDHVPSYQGGAPPGYQPITVQADPITYVYLRGNCPACYTGNLQDEFTPLGICVAIAFFPIGILCCMMLTEKRCSYCGMTYS